MLEIYTYNAGRGDCIRIRFAGTHNIFIDTGVTRFAPIFRQICHDIISAGETLDVLILTHVDDDHIGGILMNLRNSTYKCPFKQVWMNHSGGLSARNRNLSLKQNDEVYARLIERGITVCAMLKGDSKAVSGAIVETFWPEQSSIDKCMRRQRDTVLAHHSDFHVPLSVLVQQPISSRDTSQSNKNSIVFAFRYNDRNILFTGDAWAEDVIKAKGNYDLIKLPHHGSVRNISESYPSAITSSNFLICTDGSKHPDKQTIAKLEKWYGEVNIYSPSDWWSRGYFKADDHSHKIKYFRTEELVIAW